MLYVTEDVGNGSLDELGFIQKKTSVSSLSFLTNITLNEHCFCLKEPIKKLQHY